MVEKLSLERSSGLFEEETFNGDLKNRILRSFLSDDVHFLNQLVRAAGKGNRGGHEIFLS